MYTLLTLTKSSIKIFMRNKQALFFTLFMPLIIMLIFGVIGFDRPQKVDVGLVYSSPNPATQNFIDQVKSFPSFTIHEGTLTDERHELDLGNLAVVLVVPDNFMPQNATLPTTVQSLHAYLNASQGTQAQVVVSVLSQFLDKTALQIAAVPSYFNIVSETVNSRNLKYIDFLLPGLLALSLMQMAVFSVAFGFTQYKEKGILKRLVATPMRPWQFITANVITRLIIAILQTAIFLGMGVGIFHAHVIGSYFLVSLLAVLGALMFLGLGFTISGISKTAESVPPIANLVVFPMMFLCGVFFSTSNMPVWLQNIAKFLPLSYLAHSLRTVMTEGAGFVTVGGDIIAMVIWAVILIALATFTFSFQEKE